MKAINFSVKEILPSLLNKTKQQTIRPAWNDIPMDIIVSDKVEGLSFMTKDQIQKFKVEDIISKQTHIWQISKPPRFKVGEKVKLYWNQISKHTTFCTFCGKGCTKVSDIVSDHYDCVRENAKTFDKLLGTVEITEVFKIEMCKSGTLSLATENNDALQSTLKLFRDSYDNEFNIDLAKRDGFSSTEEMFKTIDDLYDLSKPKEFYCYRWRWL